MKESSDRPRALITGATSGIGAAFADREELVDLSLGALEKGKVVCIPGVKRRLLVTIARALPRRVYYKMMYAIGEKVRRKWDEM